MTRRIFAELKETKGAGNQGQENHSKALRLGEAAGRNLGRLKSDIKKMSCAKMLSLREQNKLNITATFGSNYIEFIWGRILVIAQSL